MENYFEQQYGQPLGKGAQGTVYQQEDRAIKVFRADKSLAEIGREVYIMTAIGETGLPIAHFRSLNFQQGHWVLEMDLAGGQELHKEIVELYHQNNWAEIDRHLQIMAELQVQMHQKELIGFANSKDVVEYVLVHSKPLSPEKNQKLLAKLKEMPTLNALCHNDFHSFNLLYDGQNYTIIDWESASGGDPMGDLAHSYVAMSLSSAEMADKYLEFYRKAAAQINSEFDLARMQAWLPLHAAFLYAHLPNELRPLLDRFLTDI